MLLEAGSCQYIGSAKDTILEYHRALNQREPPPRHTQTQVISSARLDTSLRSKSVTPYSENGALIYDAHILNDADEAVNILVRGESYRLFYRVRFHDEASHVEFGSLIKSVSGVELGGVLHFGDEVCHSIAEGSLVDVHLPFRCLLLPGTYFFNSGVRGMRNGQLEYLHRILDVLVFRVAEEESISVSGMIDFSAAREPTVRHR
jgi:lipopolysaccharide transport system ATP-binding protein